MVDDWNVQWGSFKESQHDKDYRYWPIPFTGPHIITLGTNYLEIGAPEACPWEKYVSPSSFLCGYGSNYKGDAYVMAIAVGL